MEDQVPQDTGSAPPRLPKGSMSQEGKKGNLPGQLLRKNEDEHKKTEQTNDCLQLDLYVPGGQAIK